MSWRTGDNTPYATRVWREPLVKLETRKRRFISFCVKYEFYPFLVGIWKFTSFFNVTSNIYVKFCKNRFFLLEMYFWYSKDKVQQVWYLEIFYFQSYSLPHRTFRRAGREKANFSMILNAFFSKLHFSTRLAGNWLEIPTVFVGLKYL